MPRGPTARPFHKQERPAAAGQAGKAPGTAPPRGAALPQWLRRPARPRVAAVGRRDGAEQRAWQHSASPKRVAPPVLRTDAWRRSVGQPLLRDNPALGSQTFTHACSSKGARRANSPLREHSAAWPPKTSSAAPHPGNPSPPQYRCARGSARRRRLRKATCMCAAGSVVPGSVGTAASKPSPGMRARLRAETSAVARPHIWQKLGLTKMGVECAKQPRIGGSHGAPARCHAVCASSGGSPTATRLSGSESEAWTGSADTDRGSGVGGTVGQLHVSRK